MLQLKSKHLDLVLRLLTAHVPNAKVLAFGSRVTGQAHDGSDLDIVVMNASVPSLPNPLINALRDALEESNLPISVDVLDWALIPESFRAQINKAYEVLQEGTNLRAKGDIPGNTT